MVTSEKKLDEKKRAALGFVRDATRQNALGAARERFGHQATAVDEYERSILVVMSWSGISVEDAIQALEGLETPHVNEVLQALNRIKDKPKK